MAVVLLPATRPTRIPFLHAGCFFLVLLSFNVAAAAAASSPTSFNFDFSGTSSYSRQDLKLEGDAVLNSDLADILCDSKVNQRKNVLCKGRMSYNHPVQFYDKNTGEVASFITSFTFVMKLAKGGVDKGNGMAFFLADYPSVLPPNSGGSLIGLTDSSTSSSSRFIAVEFDTYYTDPTSSPDHIGIDLNSMTSVSTTRLPRNSLSGTMTASITFDGSTRMLEASLKFDSNPSLATAQVKAQLPEPLDALLPPEVAVGFSGTGAYYEFHQILKWSFKSTLGPKETPAGTNNIQPSQDQPLDTTAGAESPAPTGADSIQQKQDQKPGTKGRQRQATIIGGAGAPSLAAVLASIWSVISWFKRKGVLSSLGTTGNTRVKRFDYSDLNDATGGFSEESKIGSGSDKVYKGSLRDDDDDGDDDGSRNERRRRPVAVKRIASRDSRKKGENKEFLARLEAIGRTKHGNVVRLEGWGYSVDKGNLLDFLCWCLRKRSLKLFLVYEFVPNGSLHEHLHQRPDVLSWAKRYKIVKDIASGLHYLHHKFEECISHGDIKPSNIFLDDDFNAKLGYFGLSTVIEATNETTTSDTPASSSSMAYMDPLCKKDGQAKFLPSSDIYSFGIVLLEIAHGANNPKLVRKLHTSQPETFAEVAADKKLADRFDKTQMERVIILGLLCSEPNENQRPSMVGAMQFLEKGGVLCPATPEERRGGGGVRSSSEVCALIFPSGASDTYRSP